MYDEMLTKLRSALEEEINRRELAFESLTREQLFNAMEQALKCGDFARYVSPMGQQVVYIPYRGYEDAMAEVKRIRGQLEQIKRIVEIVEVPV